MSLYDVAQKFGFWQDDKIWSLGAKPSAGQDAFIGGASAFRVTSDEDVTVNSVGVGYDDQLEIAGGGTLTATDGTVLGQNDQGHSYGIDGIVYVDANAIFSIGDAIVNFGTVFIGGVGFGAAAGDLTLNGAVAFTGIGDIDLGGDTTSAWWSGDITGGGLSNEGNTIEGAGLIGVTSLDNVAGVINAEQIGGDWLVIQATTFSNEATIEISESATLEFGVDSATRSLTNTGTINIGYYEGFANSGSDATLAISGSFAINGNGSVNFGGDDASIVSDLSTGDTFTNGSASSIHADFTGEIGNGAAVAAAANLTFDNYGSVYASGAGVTLTIDTGANTITDTGGLLEADDGATLVIDSPTTTGEFYPPDNPVAPGGTIEAASGSAVQIAASVFAEPPLVRVNPDDLLSLGQVVASMGSTVIVESGGSVDVSLDIDGGSGAQPGGVVSLLSGGAVAGVVTFVGAGGTFDDSSTSAATFDFAGGGGEIKFASSGNTADIGSTGGAWDSATGSGETVAETSALVSVVGGGERITSGAGSFASLYDTNGDWDAVNGSHEQVILTSAQAAVDGGAVTVYANAGSAVSFAGTSGIWDAFYGSADQIALSDAQASILGGGDTIFATNGSSASLYQTNGSWDAFYGSYDAVILSSAQASVLGGYDTISATAGSSVSLYDTTTHADAFTGTNDAVYLNSAQVALGGSADTVFFSGSSAATANGQYFAFYFGGQLGVSSLTGFNTSDVLHLSASDWSSFAALQASHDLFQSGANTIIQISASDKLTLVDTQLSTLSASDVKFA